MVGFELLLPPSPPDFRLSGIRTTWATPLLLTCKAVHVRSYGCRGSSKLSPSQRSTSTSSPLVPSHTFSEIEEACSVAFSPCSNEEACSVAFCPRSNSHTRAHAHTCTCTCTCTCTTCTCTYAHTHAHAHAHAHVHVHVHVHVLCVRGHPVCTHSATPCARACYGFNTVACPRKHNLHTHTYIHR